jgi:hypothetical protein
MAIHFDQGAMQEKSKSLRKKGTFSGSGAFSQFNDYPNSSYP